MRRILIILILFFPWFVQADVVVEGRISTDTTWSSSNGVYVIKGEVTIASSTTLTIEPGTIIKGNDNYVGLLIIEGKLVVTSSGTSTPTIFTSFLDDSYGGDSNSDATSTSPSSRNWRGIVFEPGSMGEFDNVNIFYAGNNIIAFSPNAAITVNNASVSIKNSVISESGIFGVRNIRGEVLIEDSTIQSHIIGIISESATTTINRSTIRNNSQEGVHSSVGGSLTLNGNSFISNGKLGIIETSTHLVHVGNTSSDLSNRGFNLSGTFYSDSTLDSSDLPILISNGGNVTVAQNATLTISPGTIIKFGSGPSAMNVEGSLVVKGDKTGPVYFTSLNDDSVGGDANGDGSTSIGNLGDVSSIGFSQTSSSTISNAVFKYSYKSIKNSGGNLNLDHVIFDSSSLGAVEQNGGNTIISQSKFISVNGIENYGTSTIDAKNNWWGNSSGPLDASTSTPSGGGARIQGNIDYVPWIGRDPNLPNPVIIIPGIMGSYLNRADSSNEEIWMNLLKMSIPGDDSYLDELKLSDKGDELVRLNPTDIIRSTGIILFTRDLFDGLIKILEHNGLVEGKDLFVFPYDWRQDISAIANNLKSEIEKVKNKTGSQKVDIVAHSMGGLVAKSYLSNFGGNSVDKFLDVGTPHVGSPKSFSTLMYGHTDITILNQKTIKTLSQNMSSVYQLLPSRNYFDETDNDYKYYVFDGVNNSQRLTFDETKQYLKSGGRNSSMVDNAELFHSEIDNLDPASYGVSTYNIVGCGTPTIGQFFVFDNRDGKYDYNIKMINGDGTVPLRSAEAVPSLRTYYVRGAQHATMPSTFGVKELVVGLLSTSTQNFDISPYPNLAMDSNNCSIPNGQLVSFHSPIDLHVFDKSGNHAGPNVDGDIENNIPGVTYETIEDDKFAFLPEGSSYTIKGLSTGEGSFDVRVEEIVGGEVTKTTLFLDVPLSTSTIVEFQVSDSPVGSISLDKDSNGMFETSVQISTTTEGLLESNGKVKIISEPVQQKLSVNRSRSSNNLARLDFATTTTPSIKSVLDLQKTKIENRSERVVRQVQVVSSTSTSTASILKHLNSNVANVQFSFVQSIKNMFKKWWSSVKRLL